MKTPTEYPDNIVHNFYFQELPPVFHKQIFLEKDPEARYEELTILLKNCWAVDLLEADYDSPEEMGDYGLCWARLVATAFRCAKLHNLNAFDLLEDFKKIVTDYAINADSVWDCHFGFKHPDGTEITEIDDFFEKALVEASDAEKSDDHENHRPV